MKRLLSLGSGPARRPLIGMLLLAFVISACGAPDRAAPATQAPVAQAATAAPPTSTASPATVALQPATVQPVPLTTPQQGQVAATPIPACTFNAATGPEPQVPGLDAYTFSEPKVILKAQSIGIAEWLPDGQHLLIDHRASEEQKLGIDIFNLQTGAVQRYAERSGITTKPAWLTAEQAVAFTGIDSHNQLVLRIGRGQGTPIEEVVTDIATPYLSVNPNGHEVVFFSKVNQGQPQAVNVSQGRQQTRSLSHQLVSKLHAPSQERTFLAPFHTAWSSDGNKIAFYNAANLYITDVATAAVCEVDLGSDADGARWAINTRWSPDGRFLALVTTTAPDLPASTSELRVLDTSTGVMRPIVVPMPFISETAWAPNSRHLLVRGNLGVTDTGQPLTGLFLVDIQIGQVRRVLPDATFGSGFYTYEGGALAWSPDGQKIAVKCPVWSAVEPLITEDRLCIIDVRP